MAVVKGQNASVDFWTKDRVKQFQKRIETRESVCFHCKGSGLGGPSPSDTAAGSVECGGCDGTGQVNRLATMVDHMLEAGAQIEDIREWFSPLLEPERKPGVIRYGGRVNVELGPGGVTVEGIVNRMDANYNADTNDTNDVSTFGGQFASVSGPRTIEVSLSISEQSREARDIDPPEGQHVARHERSPMTDERVDQGILQLATGGFLCMSCDLRFDSLDATRTHMQSDHNQEINTAAEATQMADAVLADLREPQLPPVRIVRDGDKPNRDGGAKDE